MSDFEVAFGFGLFAGFWNYTSSAALNKKLSFWAAFEALEVDADEVSMQSLVWEFEVVLSIVIGNCLVVILVEVTCGLCMSVPLIT